jgi:ketosteroid isomerase-like protein
MSQENLEVFKRATDALNRLDVGEFADCCTADYEWYPVLGGIVEGKSFRGRQGIEDYFGELRETWEEFRYVVDDIRDLGDSVLTLGRLEGRGRGSGVLVELPIGSISDYREGKCSRLRAFGDHGEALRAAGLTD